MNDEQKLEELEKRLRAVDLAYEMFDDLDAEMKFTRAFRRTMEKTRRRTVS
ncbi:MAG: hypothetical protein ACPL4E_05305 [Thermoproteota archaeon]